MLILKSNYCWQSQSFFFLLSTIFFSLKHFFFCLTCFFFNHELSSFDERTFLLLFFLPRPFFFFVANIQFYRELFSFAVTLVGNIKFAAKRKTWFSTLGGLERSMFVKTIICFNQASILIMPSTSYLRIYPCHFRDFQNCCRRKGSNFGYYQFQNFRFKFLKFWFYIGHGRPENLPILVKKLWFNNCNHQGKIGKQTTAAKNKIIKQTHNMTKIKLNSFLESV